MSMSSIKIIECPRDAMQGMKQFVNTDLKVRYINQLLKTGFDTIDFGSFVSPKAIPQMIDTAEVLDKLDVPINAVTGKKTKLLSIVANLRGAITASQYSKIDYLGFPFSISETFQLRNTNSTIEESLETVQDIQEVCLANNKELVIYISMAFGNPYGDVWNTDICLEWVEKLNNYGIKTIPMSDTVGIANPENISYLFKYLIPAYPHIEFGAHFHTQTHNWLEKLESAYKFGCTRFDSALKGYGGCPMAKDDLTGNMPTENILTFAHEQKLETGIDAYEFFKSMSIANEIFPNANH